MEVKKNHLSDEQLEVTQNCGTEPPFSGKLLNEKREGTYLCVVCRETLFKSNTKFESGSGWPSFFDAIEHKINKKKRFFTWNGENRNNMCFLPRTLRPCFQ